MSFFGKFKQALGFADTDDDDFYYQSTDEQQTDSRSKDNALTNEISSVNAGAKEPELPLEIFDSVVKLFNESLPDFLKSSIDQEAQKKYIYEQLSADMKSYLSNVTEDATQRCDSKWKDERSKLQAEMAKLKEQGRAVEEQRSEWQKQQLSAERQKRALSERVHDLEKQVATLEAEKEQYDLENKSLINKLKVSAVVDGDIEEMRKEIARLQSCLAETRKKENSENTQESNAIIEEKNAEISKLKEQIEKLEKEHESESDTGQQELKQEIEYLSEQNNKLQEAVTQLTEKEKNAEELVSELTGILELTTTQLNEKEELISELSNRQAETENAGELNEKVHQLTIQLETANAELKESHEALAALDVMQSTIEKCEAVIDKKNARIAALQDEAKEHARQIVKLEDENTSLKKTIEENRNSYAALEQKLNKEISDLKSQKTVVSTTVPESSKSSKNENKEKVTKGPKISAIDDSLDDIDWLVATPPPGVATKPESLVTDEEFGYKSPSRKPTPPENEAQMSLF